MNNAKEMVVRSENYRIMANMFYIKLFSKEMKKMYTNVMIEN